MWISGLRKSKKERKKERKKKKDNLPKQNKKKQHSLPNNFMSFQKFVLSEMQKTSSQN